MLPVEHRAIHLYRYDAYKEYSWSVDAYGSYQPASFIYLCFESFKDLCLEHGLLLLKPDELPQKSFGLVTRLGSVEDAEMVKDALNQGKNVIALFPNELIALYYQGDKNRIAQAVAAAQILGIPQAHHRITGSACNREKIKWEEIETEFKGRLFVANDAWLSDGYFMDGYGKTDENTDALTSLAREFSIFKHEIIRVSFRNQVLFWPSHEPISFIVEIVNHGPNIENILISLEVRSEFEPVSPTERELPNLSTLSKNSFAFQVIPRIDGFFGQPFKMRVFARDGIKVVTYTPDWSLEVAPSFGSAQRSYTRQDDVILSKLLTVFKDTDLFNDVSTLPKLASVDIDIRACLNRMRTVAEKLVYLVLEKKGVRLSQPNFANAIRSAQTNKILSARSIGYLHTVRVIGNLASHPSNSPLTDTDVRIVSYALACVMEEIMDKHLV